MRSLPRLWATDPVQNTGAKVGEPTKVRPDALAPQGVHPGPYGQDMGAEHLNFLLAAFTEHLAQTRYAGLLNWTKLDANFGQALTTDPLTGRVLSSLRGSYDIGAIYPHGVTTIEDAKAIFSDGTARSANHACHRKLTDGRGSFVFLGGNDEGFAAYFSTGPGTADTSTLASSTNSTQRCWGAAYDDVNGVVVSVWGLESSTAGNRVFLRLPDGDAPTLVAATTQPTIPKLPGALNDPGFELVPNCVACGGGRAIAMWETDDGYVCFTSTDGGITWNETAAPPSSAPNWFRGIWYVSDFLDRGPRFVAFAPNATDGAVLYSSPDGSLWDIVDLPADFMALDTSDSARTAAIVLGDVLIAAAGSARIGVIDLGTGQTLFHQISEDVTLELLRFDGTRLWARAISFPTYSYFVSGPITAPVDSRQRRLGMP